MKGFKDPQGKFRPTENKNGVSKSRDQSAKTQGVRLARIEPSESSLMLPDFATNRHVWGLQFENGKVSRVRLGNMVDTGWYWSGKGDQFNTFMARMADSDEWEQMVSDLNEEGISIGMIKRQLLKNLSGKLTAENDDGLYSLSGDNGRWKFGDDDEWIIEGEFDHFNNQGDLQDDEKEEFEEEFWNHYKSPTYERWLEVEGNGARQELIDGIKNSKDFDDLKDAYKEVSDNIEEQYSEFRSNESIGSASWEAVEAIQARRKKEGEDTK